MKYFIDTHDRTKGSWPAEGVSEAEFLEIYSQFEAACESVGGTDLGAHVNVAEGRLTALPKVQMQRRSGALMKNFTCGLIRFSAGDAQPCFEIDPVLRRVCFIACGSPGGRDPVRPLW